MQPKQIWVSKRGKDQLTALKRRTGIDQWNVICRWALCTSLAEPTRVPDDQLETDRALEISWETFAGELGRAYWAVVKMRCECDGLDVSDDAVVARQLRLHLHRGISYLSSNKDIQSIADLLDTLTPVDGTKRTAVGKRAKRASR